MNRLFIRLWGILEEEAQDSINHQIAQTLLDNAAVIDKTSCSSLAKLCHVSKPSISRFCKELGYDDYYDFRAELNQYCPDQGAKFMPWLDIPKQDLANAYIQDLKRSLDMLAVPGIQTKLAKLAADIEAFPRVYLLGNMQSGSTAANLRYNLHVLKSHIYAVTGFAEQKQLLENIKPGDLILIFSVSGRYFQALFPKGCTPPLPRGAKLWYITADPAASKPEGVTDILNTKTGTSLAGGNISLEIIANLTALEYKKNMQEKPGI